MKNVILAARSVVSVVFMQAAFIKETFAFTLATEMMILRTPYLQKLFPLNIIKE